MSPTTREGGLSTPSRVGVRPRLRLPRVFRSLTLQGFIFTAPLLLVFAAFVVYPMLSGLYAATDPDSYRAIFGDPVFRQTVWNTIWYVVVAVNVKLVLAVLLSGVLDYPFVSTRILAALFLIPWAIPALPGILSFRWMLNSQWGIFNHLLGKLGFDSVPWLAQHDTALAFVIIFHIWKYLPFWTIIFLAGRRAIPNELYEAAEIDGGGLVQNFFYVTFPLLKNLYLICTCSRWCSRSATSRCRGCSRAAPPATPRTCWRRSRIATRSRWAGWSGGCPPSRWRFPITLLFIGMLMRWVKI